LEEKEERFGATRLVELFGGAWLDEVTAHRQDDVLASTRLRVREKIERSRLGGETPSREERFRAKHRLAVSFKAWPGERFDVGEAARAAALANLAPHLSPLPLQKALALARRMQYGRTVPSRRRASR
jgi:hypothetical protein